MASHISVDTAILVHNTHDIGELVAGGVYLARVVRLHPAGFTVEVRPRLEADREYADEGSTWCRSTLGSEADAFRAKHAGSASS
jgi:hypothetical protein